MVDTKAHVTAARNVVLITSDDQGWWALGCSGNEEIETPNLDALAESGVRFDRMYCASPVCSPARASIHTGAIPSQHGVHDVVTQGNVGPGRKAMLAEETMLSDVLSEAGYHCGMIGKWHLGASDRPQNGFDDWYAVAGGMSNYWDAKVARGTQLGVENRYLTDAITDESIDFIARAGSGQQPFFLNINYTAPHSPWVDQHPQEFVERYLDCAFESCPQEPHHPWGPTSSHPDNWAAVMDPLPSLRGYYASVTAMDAGIGRVLEALERQGHCDDTVVIFISDNGFSCGHNGIWGKGNATFPANMLENSVRVPAMMAGPGIAEGVVSTDLASAYDVVPTVLDLLDLQHSDPHRLVGRSFADRLRDHSLFDDDPNRVVVVYSEYGPTRMIRSADWKYVHRYPYGPNELYDMVEDPKERKNLADLPMYADRQRQLRRELEAWFNAHVDPRRDGTRQPVLGTGQRDFVDDRAQGAEAFFPPEAYAFPRIDLRNFMSRQWPGTPPSTGAR